MKLKYFLLLTIVCISFVSAVSFVEPLELRRWTIEILAGSPAIFTAIALIALFGLAGFFRMNMLITMFMLAAFFLFFRTELDQSIYFVVLSIGGLVVGNVLHRIISR